MLKARCFRLAPLLFGGNHIVVIFAPDTCITNCFFVLQMQKMSLPWEGGPLPDPSCARLLRSLADYFGRHGNIGHSRGARSLIIKINVSETACSKLDVIVLPLGIWRKSYSSNLCPKYMHQKLFCFVLFWVFWGGSKCKIFPALGDPPPFGCFATSQFSSQITFGDMEI